MVKNEIYKWEQIYELPISYDGLLYCWSKNNTMSLMFNDTLNEEQINKIINSINGIEKIKIEKLSNKGCDFFINEKYVFCVRGWGKLTGVGALNLSVEKAVKIQDGFIKHIKNSLS